MGRGWRERRGEFDPQNRSNATPPDDADDVEAWDRERERYRNRR
jgi:hypothetical protein